MILFLIFGCFESPEFPETGDFELVGITPIDFRDLNYLFVANSKLYIGFRLGYGPEGYMKLYSLQDPQ